MSPTVKAPWRMVLASNNAKKLAELQAAMGGLAIDWRAQGEWGVDEAEEPHATFLENALAKARHAARATGLPALADDSGLCVHALGGAPGVGSAHHAGRLQAQAGEPREALRRRQDAANNARLLDQLQGCSDRRAHYTATLVAVRAADDPEPLVAVGRWAGEVLRAPLGEGGFGYDPLIWMPPLGASVAQLAAEVKGRESHRARAAQAMTELLRSVWHLGPGA